MTIPPGIRREVVHEPFWAIDATEVFSVLHSRPEGLAEEEVSARRALFGPNEIPDRRRLTKTRLVFSQLSNPFIIVLVFAGAITLAFREWVQAAVIFAAVAANTALGFWQEWKAETTLAFLRTYVRTRARVRRAGAEREIDASLLVPGDLVRIAQGDRVPADLRLIFVADLEVDESVLTGESLPAAKREGVLPAGTALGERGSMAFSGTLVVGGFGDGVVTATGAETEFGKIASLLAHAEREPTPLQRAMGRFSARAGLILGILVLLLFGVGVVIGYDLFEMFLIAVAVAVSAVPEGLPVALTVVLAIGVERLARRRGVVRRLLAAETLGSTTLILTDKTGTLTEAKMALAAVLPRGAGVWSADRPPAGQDRAGHEIEARLLADALRNTDVILENPDDPPRNWRVVGRPLETALVVGAARLGVRLPEVAAEAEIIERLPFRSEYKFSASVSRTDSRYRLILLGAPEVLLDYCDLVPAARDAILATLDRRARGGERVLGVASREFTGGGFPSALKDRAFRNLVFRGLIAFRDPVRSGVSAALHRIAEAGVRTAITTGDHPGTAEAVARELGMVDGKGAVLTGRDLEALRPEELAARADSVAVYARVTPEQKLGLVRLYQARGEVVAVTGDGVNDTPALQAADIGIAVGSGTDVAKSAADLVILDDNFETIVSAIEEGRNILSNIRKVVVYLLSDVFDELFLIGGALVAGVALPLSALQILFVNFFSDSFPAVALAFERGVDGPGRRPRRLDRNFFDPEMRFLILVIGVSTSFLLLVLYLALLRLGFPPELVRTFIFASFGTYTLFLSFSVRSLSRSIFAFNPFSNRHLVAGVAVGLLLTAAVLYVPLLQEVFGTVALPAPWLAAVFGVGVVNVAAVECSKWLFRRSGAV